MRHYSSWQHHARYEHRHFHFIHAAWHAHARRHRGFSHGRGRHGHPGDSGMEGFGVGRKLRSSDLQLLILTLLAERPRHGYELIHDIEERSKGYYSPSPGMIYPALSYIEEGGHALVEIDGAKKRYSLTAEGSVFLATNRVEADALIAELAQMGERMERARQAWSGEVATEEEDEHEGLFGRFRGQRRITPELHDAYHAIKKMIRAKIGASATEQGRVAAVLMQAAEEIGSAGKSE